MRRLFIALLFSTLLLSPSVALAAADPSSDPSLDVIYANRNLISSGDMLFYAQYNIPYASVPDERIDQLYLFLMLDSDGNVLATNEAYAYVNKGTGKGIISFYFAPADAPVWGSAYTIRLQQKISIFPSPLQWNFIIPPSAYSSASTQVANRAELKTNIQSIAQSLQTDWGSSYDLLDETDTGTVLSDQGEAYFRESINGLQAMCPELFYTIIVDPDYASLSVSENGTYATELEGQLPGTPYGGFSNLWATMWGVDFSLIAGMPLLIGAVGFVVGSAMYNNQAWSGFICAEAIAIVGFAGGWLPRGIIGLIVLVTAFILIGLIVRKVMTQ